MALRQSPCSSSFRVSCCHWGISVQARTELVRATAKRWLRLVCLVMLAVLLSWLLFRCGLYRHREAATLS
jgi:hypothetical protein